MRIIAKSLLLFCLLLPACPLFSQFLFDPADPLVDYDSTAAPPQKPSWGQPGKWVRTRQLNWNSDAFKAYIYKDMAFRLKFPKTYAHGMADGKRYPVIVFFHGLGERGSIYDNELHLYHGGQPFAAAVDEGRFDGYVLFVQSPGFFGPPQYAAITELVDYLTAHNKLDPFRVSVHGLSAGGQATWDMVFSHPSYVAAAAPMSSASITYEAPAKLDIARFLPIWLFQGGLDGSPAPYTSQHLRDALVGAGARFTYTEYADLGHGVWDRTWTEPGLFPFFLQAYGSNPWALGGRSAFCPGDPVQATLGLAPGFQAYEWRKDGVIIPGATSNTLTVTELGVYDARVQRNGTWSDWSRIPVHVSIKSPTVTPQIAVSGIRSKVLPALDGSTTVPLELPAGYTSYRWQAAGGTVALGHTRFLTAGPGQYEAAVTEPYGCSSDLSPLFKVVPANGPNKPEPALHLFVTQASPTSLRLDWSDHPAPAYNETVFEIYSSAQPGGPYTLIGFAPQDATSYTVSGLPAQTRRYYRVRAVNEWAAAGASNEASCSTVADTEAPVAPADLRVVGTTRNTIATRWRPAQDNIGVVKYDIYVNGQKLYATSDTQFNIAGLQAAAVYNIQVKARDAAGNSSAFSNQVTGKTVISGLQYKYYTFAGTWNNMPDFNTLMPAATGIMPNVALHPRTQNDNFAFLWEGYIHIPVSGTYTFRTNSDDGSKVYLGAAGGTGSPYAYLGTEIVNNDGLHGAKDESSAPLTLSAGIYPIAITFYEQGGGEVMNLSWSHPQTGGQFVPIPDSAFTEPLPAGGAAPVKPSALTAVSVSHKRIDLSWADNSGDETGFEIWRSTSPFTGFVTIGRTAADVTSFTDGNLQPNSKYYYRVRAVNDFGESDFDKTGQGIEYEYYEQTGLMFLPDFNTLTPKKRGRQAGIGLGMQEVGDQFQVKFSGIINIPVTGLYTFYTSSDDGSRLYIDGFDAAHLVVDNDGLHAEQERSGTKHLARGAHTIYVTFFESGGGEVLRAQLSGPMIAKQPIPDHYLGEPLASAITKAPPNAAAAPAGLEARGSSATAIGLSWTDAASNEEAYEVFRSGASNANHVLLATLPPNTTAFTDSGLYANSVYYYKVRSVNANGPSAFSNTDSATTINTAPVMAAVPHRTAQRGAVTTISLSAADADGDPLQFSGLAFPAFAQLTDHGNRSATLTLQPSAAQQGVYTVQVVVADPHGGKDTALFHVTVNDNSNPVITAIPPQSMDEGGTLTLDLLASDANAVDVISWTVTGFPANLQSTTNGVATLQLQAGYGDAGQYTIVVEASDGAGGLAAQSFVLTVREKDPTEKIYVRFQDAAVAPSPWNNVTAATASALRDAAGVQTGIGLSLPSQFFVNHLGPQTGDNSGVYPDAVLQDFYYFGTWWAPQTANLVLNGLNPQQRYNISFYAGSNWDIAADNGSTVYTSGGQSVTLYVQQNTSRTVSLHNLQPAPDGTLTVEMTRGAGAQAGYLNAFVIHPLYGDGSAPEAPAALVALNGDTAVKLQWEDRSYNESAFEIYRAAGGGPFERIGTATADAPAFTDPAPGNQSLAYKVRAVNSVGASAFTEVATVQTPNRAPRLEALQDIVVKSQSTVVIPLAAADDAGETVQLSVSGLPPFVSFSGGSNGSGQLTVQPAAGTAGYFPGIEVTAMDNRGAVAKRSFSIMVTEGAFRSVYLNFSDGGALAGAKPWNNLNGWPFANTIYYNMLDESGVATGINLSLPDGFTGIHHIGMRARNGREIYPEAVTRIGMYDTTSTGARIVVSGLDGSKRYNFVFFNSREDGLNSTTIFSVNGQPVELDASYNINKTVQLNGIAPDGNDRITLLVKKAPGADYAYINNLVIQAYDPAAVTLAGPAELRHVAADESSIQLQWQDRSAAETGYEVWRAKEGSAQYSQVATLPANSTSYRDSLLESGTSYFYTVRAVNGTVASPHSNIAAAYTYAYRVFINFNKTAPSGSPWNNTNTIPQAGSSWSGLRDAAGSVSSMECLQAGAFTGLYADGMTTAGGLLEGSVSQESYGLFAGQSATLKIGGLLPHYRYNFTFYASSGSWGDVNTAYSIGGKTSLLNAARNTQGTLTMYDIAADINGEVVLKLAPGTSTSQLGLIGALVVQGFLPATAPAPQPVNREVTVGGASNIGGDAGISVYPNPFQASLTIALQAARNEGAQITLMDVHGRVVQQQEVSGLKEGRNLVTLHTGRSLPPGVYFVRVNWKSGKGFRVVKVIRQ